MLSCPKHPKMFLINALFPKKLCVTCEWTAPRCLDQYGEVWWFLCCCCREAVWWCGRILHTWLLSTSNMLHCQRALEFCWYGVIICVDLHIGYRFWWDWVVNEYACWRVGCSWKNNICITADWAARYLRPQLKFLSVTETWRRFSWSVDLI